MATQMIRMILLDGDPEGLRSASIAGRTTVVIACPYTQLKRLLAREEAKRPSIYFMVGPPAATDTPSPHELAIYIGECDSLVERFAAPHHRADAAEWNQFFLATTTEGTFNKAHARLAEFQLRARAHEAARSLVLTKVASAGNIDEGDSAFASEFTANVVTLAQTLGLGVFRAPASKMTLNPTPGTAVGPGLPSALPAESASKETFEFAYTAGGPAARMILDGNEFIVAEGSMARSTDLVDLPDASRQKRVGARAAGILVSSGIPGLERFTADYATTSASAAGEMVYGSSCAGPKAWRHVGTNLIYKDWLAKQTGTQHG